MQSVGAPIVARSARRLSEGAGDRRRSTKASTTFRWGLRRGLAPLPRSNFAPSHFLRARRWLIATLVPLAARLHPLDHGLVVLDHGDPLLVMTSATGG
jgi:hypothetical protein